jgi:N-dimethylarginine dimethylaminohydrolase
MKHLRAAVYERSANLPNGFAAAELPAMEYPIGVLVVPPTYFDVIDVKNPFMAGKAGSVDRDAAMRQFESLCAAFERAGLKTERLDALPGCEDMVFVANTALLGVDADGSKTCVPGRMTFESRRAEVAPIVEWSKRRGYRIAQAGDSSLPFEGGGDALWHPGRRLLWGGYGWRSDPRVYPALAEVLGTPVIMLPLTSSTYYHLDTCFCPIDERTALVHPIAIAEEGMQLVRRAFQRVIEVDAREAECFACNAAAFFGRVVVIDRRASVTAGRLRDLAYDVIEVDTGEFLKSGGSVYCMKNAFY